MSFGTFFDYDNDGWQDLFVARLFSVPRFVLGGNAHAAGRHHGQRH